jgi:hypothetical protein
MLARGTQPHVLGEVEVGLIVQLHLKRRHKKNMSLTPQPKAQKSKYWNLQKKTVVNKK